MSEPIRYTPRAVQLIRNGASAADLGWSPSMYDSVCATHGIACGPKPHEIIHYKNPKAQVVEFRPASSEVLRGSIIVALPRAQAELFAALYKRWLSGDETFASGAKLCHAASEKRLSMRINRAVQRISPHLTPLRIWIETKPRVGYRLRVDA